MYIPRLKGDDIKSSKYYVRPYSTGDMPNCTTYSAFRMCELLDRQCIQNLGGSRIEDPCFPYDGYRNACVWHKDWLWDKGQVPKLGAIACWSGVYKATGKACAGHVAVVEAIYNDGSFLTSNSNYGGTWFYTQKIGADKALNSSKYTFTFEGFCYLPLREVERDESKHQVQVKVDGLRIRSGHSTDSEVIGQCGNGELFNVIETYDNGSYKWMNVDIGWIATKPEWIVEYVPVQSIDELQQEIVDLKNEIRELNLINANLRSMLNTCEEGAKLLNEKIEKAKEALK